MKRFRLVLARVESVSPDGSAVLKPLADRFDRPGYVRDVLFPVKVDLSLPPNEARLGNVRIVNLAEDAPARREET